MTDTLRCSVCSREVRVVRLNRQTLALGHVRQPHPSHPARLPHQCRDCGATVPRAGNHPRERCQPCAIAYRRADAPRRFWAKLQRPDGEGGCWLWPGAVDKDGYGHARPHRMAYRLAKGPIPRALVVRHTCDVPRCCNPSHLILGTQADNIADRDARGRTARGDRSGMRLHPHLVRRGEASPRAKLTNAEATAIRELLAEGHKHRDIAARFGVGRSTVTAINRGQNWHHVVRLSRSAAERPFAGLEDSRRQTEGSNLSPDPALPREPRRARRVRAGSLPTPSGARVVVGPPSTPRAPLGAGRR